FDQIVSPFAINVGDEPYAAGVVLHPRVIEGWSRKILRAPIAHGLCSCGPSPDCVGLALALVHLWRGLCSAPSRMLYRLDFRTSGTLSRTRAPRRTLSVGPGA